MVLDFGLTMKSFFAPYAPENSDDPVLFFEKENKNSSVLLRT